MSRTPVTDGGFDRDRRRPPPCLTYEVAEGELTSEGVVRAVATFTDTPLLDLEPLHDVVDPDYLDGVSAAGDIRAELSFVFHGCEVTVAGHEVRVRPVDGDSRG